MNICMTDNGYGTHTKGLFGKSSSVERRAGVIKADRWFAELYDKIQVKFAHSLIVDR